MCKYLTTSFEGECQKKWPQEVKLNIQELERIGVLKSKNATPATDKFPVILFEHGLGIATASYQRIFLELVSHGYVVIAPGHPYIAGVVCFKDGTQAFKSGKAVQNALTLDTALSDTLFILRKIDEIARNIPSMDPQKIGVIGHSLGGATIMKAVRTSTDSRIMAGISLDPPISYEWYTYPNGNANERTPKTTPLPSDMKLDSGSNFEKPFLHIFAEKSMTDHSTIQLGKDNFKAIIKGIGHNSLAADYGILKGIMSVCQKVGLYFLTGDAEPSSYQTQMMRLIQSFFDKFIKGKSLDLMQENSAEGHPLSLREGAAEMKNVSESQDSRTASAASQAGLFGGGSQRPPLAVESDRQAPDEKPESASASVVS